MITLRSVVYLLTASILMGCGRSATTAMTSTATTEPSTPPTTKAPIVETSPTQTEGVMRSATAAATSSPSPVPATRTPSPGTIVVDHDSVALFSQIPDEYVVAAEHLRMLYMDRSVGQNINDALDCLQFPNTQSAPNRCSRTEHVDPAYSVDPSVVAWNRPGGYDRSNWVFQTWPQGPCSSWDQKIGCFLNFIAPVIGQYDVVSYQLSYLAVDSGSSINDQPGGFFFDNPSIDDVFDQEAFEAAHPDKVFIYWTTSLARGIGTEVSDTFNQNMREYAVSHGEPLFDVADILSHTPDDSPCFDNRDGVPYSNGNSSEDYPDDGQERLAICPQYTTEVDGGHLGSVSSGSITVAKAFWVLMAQIAGWTP